MSPVSDSSNMKSELVAPQLDYFSPISRETYTDEAIPANTGDYT